MFGKLRTWAEAHPAIVMYAASFVMIQLLYTWHEIVKWTEALEQLNASETLGG